MAQNIHKAYPLTTAWTQLEPSDDKRRGVLFQNRSTNTPSIIVAQGEQSDTFAGLELTPSGTLYEDILPANGELWARTVTGTATLTLVLKY